MKPPPDAAQHIVNKTLTLFRVRSPGAVAAYLAEILAWNASVGLVSRADPTGACERLLFESLELDRLLEIEARARIADVGSGAGFPGVVWALQHPESPVTLIERRQRKAAFLERTCRTLTIANATVLALDVRPSAAPDTLHRAFDLVVTMAVGDPADSAAQLDWMLAPGARFATTISRDRVSPPAIGQHLHLLQTTSGEFGRYAVYQAGV